MVGIGNKRVMVMVSEGEYEYLRGRASGEGRSMSSMIRAIVKREIEREKREGVTEE